MQAPSKSTRRGPGGSERLTPQRKWRAITVATLIFAPACWFILTGFVAGASDRPGGPDAPAAFAAGLALIPFVFIVLAFMSGHPRAAGAVIKAMGLSLLVGVVVSVVANDGVTGLVAGAGAGGIVALRSEADHDWKLRAAAVLFGALYTFVLVRIVGAVALLPAPIFAFTGIGLADHFSERRHRSVST